MVSAVHQHLPDKSVFFVHASKGLHMVSAVHPPLEPAPVASATRFKGAAHG